MSHNLPDASRTNRLHTCCGSDIYQISRNFLPCRRGSPTIVAAYHRLRKGQVPVAPQTGLGHAANYLYMLNNKAARPEHIRALDSYFTLLADHSLNASTFVARIAASTLTDVHSAVVAAISALKGPLHGGAPIYVWEMLQSIRTP